MLCPYCLTEEGVAQEPREGRTGFMLRCRNAQCREEVWPSYVNEYRRYPPAIVSAVGWRAHGKTVYFASLLHAIEHVGLEHCWPKFFKHELDQHSLDVVVENSRRLHEGVLPPASLKNFPRPTMLRLRNVPCFSGRTLLLYDTAGECFQKGTNYVEYAGFVKRAQTAMLVFSLPDMQDPAREMEHQLTVYLNGLDALCVGDRRVPKQHLLVVFTKADEMLERFADRPDLQNYLRQSATEGLEQMDQYLGRLRCVSRQLNDFTQRSLGARQFMSAARARFRTVDFCIVSALGTKPQGDRLVNGILPRRVFDPLFWVLRNARPAWSWWSTLFS